MDRNGNERFLDEIVSVESFLHADGTVTVRSFLWQGRRIWVSAAGRQWVEESGTGIKRCALVMSADNMTFELCLDGTDGLWHLRRTWSPQHAV